MKYLKAGAYGLWAGYVHTHAWFVTAIFEKWAGVSCMGKSWTGHLSANKLECLKNFCNKIIGCILTRRL